MTVLLFCLLGQLVSFDNQQYCEVSGTPEQQLAFYVAFRDSCSPDWRNNNQAFWAREWERVTEDVKTNKAMWYRSDRATTQALARVIVCRGYVVRFKVIVQPFGSFWLYYNSAIHALLMILGLLGIVGWMKWRKRKRQSGSVASRDTS